MPVLRRSLTLLSRGDRGRVRGPVTVYRLPYSQRSACGPSTIPVRGITSRHAARANGRRSCPSNIQLRVAQSQKCTSCRTSRPQPPGPRVHSCCGTESGHPLDDGTDGSLCELEVLLDHLGGDRVVVGLALEEG
eukprot:3937854-Prymnesium_polylepis.1